MSQVARAPKERSKAEPEKRPPAPVARAPVQRQVAGWGTGYGGAPFALGGVQRQVAIGQVNDPYEQEAERVASTIASGGRVAPESILQIGSGGPPVGQRAPAPAPKREEKPKTPPVQKAAAPPTSDKKKEGTPASTAQKAGKPDEKKPVQKAAKPEEKKPVQKAAAPTGEKKKETKPPAAQRAEKARTGEERNKPAEEKLKETPVQRASEKAESAAADKKKESKPTPAAQKAAKQDEKKPVQKAAAPDEKEPEPSGETMQLAAQPDAKKPEPKKEGPKAAQKSGQPAKDKEKAEAERAGPIQRDAGEQGTTPSPTMEQAAERAIHSKGAGEPMHEPTRQALERGMGLDFSDVRVHHGGGAQDASRDLGARAFTHGNDIWLGAGESPHNVGLMAHEATHVAQQTGSVHRMIVQRVAAASSATGATLQGDEIHIPTLFVPEMKKDDIAKVPTPWTLEREERTPQAAEWRSKVKPAVEGKLPGKLIGLPGIRKSTSGHGAEDDTGSTQNKTYILQVGSEDTYIIGTVDQLIDELTIPRWDPEGRRRMMDVDHKLELQLGGGASDETNFQLLDASANRSSGAKIAQQLNQAVAAATRPEVGQGKRWPKTPKASEVQAQGIKIIVGAFDASLQVAGNDKAKWPIETVKGVDEPFAKLKPLSAAEAASKNLIGQPTGLVIFPASGGKPKERLPWSANKGTGRLPDNFLRGIQPGTGTITYHEGQGGEINGTINIRNREKQILEPKPFNAKLQELAGIPYTTVIDRSSLTQAMRWAEFKYFSPIEFSDVGIDADKGIFARGKLRPSLPIFKDLELDIGIEGENAFISKTFTKDDFKFPGPIQVTDAGVTLAVGTEGFSVSGIVNIQVERLGKGQLTASVSTRGGFEIEGTFEFDTKLFDPAKIRAGYKDGEFSGEGEIGIPAGRVKGIRSARIRAGFRGDTITASGSVQPSIPGIEQADMTMSYSPEQGLIIGGHLELKKDIPGIAGGSVDATLTKAPGSEDYKVRATGTATPKIPGISAQITVTYDDGAFDIAGTAAYEKGLLKGSITVGATNRPIGEDGQPSAAPPAGEGRHITLYGGGSLTLRIAPWLEATAAVKLKPNGEIEVTGRIGLPAVLEIFKEKALDKNIFTIGIDIPIVGVAVLGQRIGIFANISGGLDLSAGIGPGQLQDLHLEVTYNPAHEEQTHVAGAAKLHIPAHAGLRLFVRGSLGVGIPIVSASAGLEIGGGLGLEGALDAAVNVDWTPTKGLDITASAEIFVEPKLQFDITGFVLVEADLWIKTIELYSKRWQLASLEYGSGLRFGLRLPIHYQEGRPFDISWSDIEIIKPDLNATDILTGLIKKIA